MFKIFLVFSFLVSTLTADTYIASSEALATDKISACKKALNRAKDEAISEAGTFVISSFKEQISVHNTKVDKFNQSKLSTISLGLVKLISKKESVKIKKDYQFSCKVEAIFTINETDMKKAIQNYISKKQTDKNKIAVKAIGYSEEGQSKYRAFKVAKLDATRNLLEEIKGSKLFSTIETEDGSLVADKIINGLNGNIRFVKVLSQTYDRETKSAEIVVGLTNGGLEYNLKGL